MTAPMLQLDRVSCELGGHTVVKNFSLSIDAGEIVSLLGPSGSGKTTVLRMLAGFEQPAGGSIQLRGQPVADSNIQRPPEQRNLGLVQQDYALFPHLSVTHNVAFGLRRLVPEQRTERVQKWLALVGLSDKHNRMPHQLSGGEQQRVAVARALAPEPDLLLLDEPFSNLDTQLREQLAGEMRALLKTQKITTLLVTHDQREAQMLADRVAVMKDGVLQQVGSNDELFNQPANRFVAEFISGGQWLALEGSAGQWRCALGPVDVEASRGDQLLLRQQDVQLQSTGASARIVTTRFLGSQQQCRLELDSGDRIDVLLTTEVALQTDQVIAVSRAPTATTVVFPSPD